MIDQAIGYALSFFNYGIIIYAVTIMTSYIILGVVSFVALRSYIMESKYQSFSNLFSSPYAPSIALIAPAYNESTTIVENIRSLLSLHYPDFKVVIVNDGSKDDTLQKAIDAYQLVKVDYAFKTEIPCSEIRNVYKSTLSRYRNLIVVDKVNGGKADALNAGINVADMKYVACIDVDCILEQDALLKMVKPFLQHRTKVIATGGVIRIANSCKIESGKITQVNLPKGLITKIQVLEYLRAFLLGRMAWSKMDGLLLISGAFGMFDREVLIRAGGYNTQTVGEDMELLVRMRRYMIENRYKYRVCFIPDPLCWTEVPESREVLAKQRNRWTRGNIETLCIHKRMFLNPRYKVLGLLSYPYWLFYEYLAPKIEFFGALFVVVLAIFGLLYAPFYFSLLLMVYTFAVMISAFSLVAEEYTYFQYKSIRDIGKLFGAALLEPLVFHPFVVIAALRGTWDLIRGKKSWGDMKRKGFTTPS